MAMLRDMGHSVTEATGGIDALERLTTGLCPDVVISDFKMPQMSGAQLAKVLDERWPTLPILIVTGYIEDDREVTGTQILMKPFRQVDLAVALRHTMQASVPP